MAWACGNGVCCRRSRQKAFEQALGVLCQRLTQARDSRGPTLQRGQIIAQPEHGARLETCCLKPRQPEGAAFSCRRALAVVSGQENISGSRALDFLLNQ